MDPARPRAEAIAIDDGTVVAVGTLDEARAALPGAPVHAPDAAAIVPGLIDSHLHMQWAGLKLLEHFGEAGPDSTAAAFEVLDGPGLHWNGAADPTLAERLAALRLIQPVLHSVGIVGVVDPGRRPRRDGRLRRLPQPRRADHAGRADAPSRPHAAAPTRRSPRSTGSAPAPASATRPCGSAGSRSTSTARGKTARRCGASPGPNASRRPTAAAGSALPDEEFLKLAAWCAREGWSMGVHCVGGGGIDKVLDAWLKVDAETPIAGLGFTLIHAYLEPSPANMELAARLGVLVAAQPAIHWSNGASLEARLGPEARGANPIASWLDAGVAVGGGSDGPYFPIDPRLGLWQTRTREVAGGDEAHAPELALDAEQALALYTTGAAAVSLAAGRRGALAPGQAADWVALSVDPLAADPAAVREMTAIETAVGGATVAHRSQPPPEGAPA